MTSHYKEKYQSNATVFILKDKTWIERGSGVVRFVFDLKSFALSLIVRPGMPDEYSCKLRPRIRSKGPRAYVVRAEKSATNQTENILAVRFEREEDSRAFRRFVEKREGDHHQKKAQEAAAMNTGRFQPGVSGNDPRYDMDATKGKAGYMDPYTAADMQYRPHAHTQHQIPNVIPMNPNHPNQMIMNSHTPGVVGVGMQGQNSAYPGIRDYIRQQQMQHNENSFYFWNCPNCRQMQDITVASCIVCGARRPPGTATTPMMNMHTGSNQYLNSQTPNAILNNNMRFQSASHAHPHAQSFSLNGAQTPLAMNTQPNNYNNVLQNMQNMNFIPNQNVNVNQNVGGFANANPNQSHPYQPLGSHYNVDFANNAREANRTRSRGYASSSLKPIIVELTNANLEKHNVLYPPLRRNVGEIIYHNLQHLERLKLKQQTVN